MENTGVNISKIAIEFIMVALFLSIALRVIYLRDSYSDAYTKRQDTEIALSNSLEFGKYTGNKVKTDRVKTVTGGEVLEALRNYRHGEAVIYIDKTKHNATILQSPATINAAPASYTVEALSGVLDMRDLYYPYLVYDNADPVTQYGNTGLEVTGITFIKK